LARDLSVLKDLGGLCKTTRSVARALFFFYFFYFFSLFFLLSLFLFLFLVFLSSFFLSLSFSFYLLFLIFPLFLYFSLFLSVVSDFSGEYPPKMNKERKYEVGGENGSGAGVQQAGEGKREEEEQGEEN
jgi:hypothetical protein